MRPLNPEQWQRAEELFFRALDCPREEREKWLDLHAGDDPELRQQISAMLAADDAAGARIESAVGLGRHAAEEPGDDVTATLEGQRLGRYLLVREIGHGGMGAVYQAIRADGEFHQAVAIKVIRSSMRSEAIRNRFRQERHILARLNHPNIVRMFDGGTTPDGQPYLVMDLIDGVPITEYCATRKLDRDEKLRLFLQICDGIQHAHSKQVIHRDLKPANILVTPEGGVRLLDFGIAKWLDPGVSPEEPFRTATGFTPLTPDYASPEQYRGESPGERSDVYSLGAILFEIVTGERASSLGLTARRAAAGDLGPVIERALELEPERRFASVAELAASVRSFTNPQPAAATQPSDEPRVSGPVPRRRLWWALAAIGMLGFAAGVWWSLFAEDREVEAVAVLPFVDLDGSQREERLADGLTEDIITQLAQIPGLQVVSRNAVWQYRGKSVDPREVGRKLDVDAVLEGSVRRSRNRVRLVVQLISVRDGYHLWAQQYDRTEQSSLVLQDSLATLVAGDLRRRLAEAGTWNRAGRVDVESEAYRAYLEGYQLFQMNAIREEWAANPEVSGLPPMLEETIRSFERATRLDPRFAAGWAGLAEVTEWAAGLRQDLRGELLERSRTAARRALNLEPTNALATATLGIIALSHDWDLHSAESYLRRAIELSPRSTGIYADYASSLVAMGRYDDAKNALERSQLFEPGSARPSGRLAVLAALRDDPDGARFYAGHALAREPGNRHALWALAYADERSGEPAAAARRYEELLRQYPTEDRTLASLGSLRARQGKRAEAILIAGKLHDMIVQGRRREVFEALVRTALNDRRTALALLEEAWTKRDPNLLDIELDGRFATLRDQKRFREILTKLRSLR